jgi:uncharacterized protein (TIGR02217 family)
MPTFHEVQFPTDISYGSSGGPGFSTKIIESDSGDETRIARWAQARRRYNVAYGVKSYAQLAAVRDFYLARRGPLYGFRYKDFTDCTSSATGVATELGGAAPTNVDQTLVRTTDSGLGGDGSCRTFQLRKVYNPAGPSPHVRTIGKPVAGTVVVALNGVNQSSGWTVDITTGVVTFTTAPGVGVVVTAGFQFDVPVRFGMEVDEAFRANIDQFGHGSMQDIPLIEIKDLGSVSDGGEYSYGGACEYAIAADLQLVIGAGRVVNIQATVGSLKVILPSVAALAPGAPYLYVCNDASGVNSFDIYDSDGTTYLVTLAPGQGIEAILTMDGSGVKRWLLL